MQLPVTLEKSDNDRYVYCVTENAKSGGSIESQIKVVVLFCDSIYSTIDRAVRMERKCYDQNGEVGVRGLEMVGLLDFCK